MESSEASEISVSDSSTYPQPIDIIVKNQPILITKDDKSDSSDDDEYHDALDDRKFYQVLKSANVANVKIHAQQNTFHLLKKGNDDVAALPRLHGTSRHVRSRSLQPYDTIEVEYTTSNNFKIDENRSPLIDEHDTDIDDEFFFCFPALDAAKEQAINISKKIWIASWKVTHFYSLPEWLQDNDFLHTGHRPPLPSFAACFRSIFRVHTETGNIWTHMIGCVAFIGIAAWFLTRPHKEVQWEDKLAFLPFFIGAVACLGLSFAFHTVYCHSEKVGRLFSKLDYVGIALLIMGSFVPWLHYGFYCSWKSRVGYISAICFLGACCIVVSLWDRFSEPRFRPLRAGLFMGLGLSALIPCGHYFVVEGLWSAIYEASIGWLALMALLYLSGALLYAFRVPERFFPGKCDIMFQSHQIFHVFVVAAAFVHYHGVMEMAVKRLSGASCIERAEKFIVDHLVSGGQSLWPVVPNFEL